MRTASEWKEKAREASERFDLTLPSGMVVTARRPGPLQLAFFRRIPLALAQQVVSGETVDPQSITAEEIVENVAFMRDLLTYCLLDPRISLDPQGDDEIHPRDIPEKDWKYILGWAMRSEEAEKLRPFRVGRGGDGARGDGQIVELPTLGAAEDSGPGFGVEF